MCITLKIKILLKIKSKRTCEGLAALNNGAIASKLIKQGVKTYHPKIKKGITVPLESQKIASQVQAPITDSKDAFKNMINASRIRNQSGFFLILNFHCFVTFDGMVKSKTMVD